jgi:hypothetical protein
MIPNRISNQFVAGRWPSSLKFLAIVSCLAGAPCLMAQQNHEPEFAYDPGPYLLLDQLLIFDQANIHRTIHQPERLPDPVVTSLEDENFQPYVTVIRYPDEGIFRMWYNTPVNMSQSHLAHITSPDGIHWDRPHQVLEDPAHINFGASVLDRGPDYPTAAERFVYGFWAKGEDDVGGLKIAVSPDGLEWKMLRPGVILPHNHDINSVQWDPIREQYMAFMSVNVTEGPTWSGIRRRTPHQSVSKDLINWEDLWRIIQPEMGEWGETQFYCMNGLLRRGHLLVGLVKVLRDDLNAEANTVSSDLGDPERKAAGIGYTTLAWSRDGRTWQRDIEPFFDRNSLSGAWDRAHAWVDCQVPVGDEVYLYYGGYARGHKAERFRERQVGLAKMKRDRYVSWDADFGEGRLTTAAAELTAKSMTVNADILGFHGSLRVRVLNEDRETIEGFDFAECQLVQGNSLRHPVAWEKDLSELEGQRIQFEFSWTNGSLFSFDLNQ